MKTETKTFKGVAADLKADDVFYHDNFHKWRVIEVVSKGELTIKVVAAKVSTGLRKPFEFGNKVEL